MELGKAARAQDSGASAVGELMRNSEALQPANRHSDIPWSAGQPLSIIFLAPFPLGSYEPGLAGCPR